MSPLRRGAALLLALTVTTGAVAPAAVGSTGDVDVARAAPVGAEGTFVPIDPVRVVDTRSGLGGRSTKLGSEGTMTFDPALGDAIPTTDVSAVLLNVTGTEPTQPTHVRVWPSGTPLPATSSLNLTAGQSRPNQVVVPVGDDGRVALYNHRGSTHLVVDVQGWYSDVDGLDGGGYHPTATPYRAYDSREDAAGAFRSGEEGVIVVNAPDMDLSTVWAVDVNLTVTGPTSAGHLTAWPGDLDAPSVSNVNFAPGQTVANHAVVPVTFDEDGNATIVIRNSAGSTHVIVDVQGWYDDGSRTDGLRFAVSPTSRVADTRETGPRIANGGTLTVPGSDLPADAVAHVVNITATASTGPGHLTAWAGEGALPATSTLNFATAEDSPNLATVLTGSDGQIAVTARSSASHIVVDHIGYFW